jgi:L-ascorbate metabolism protein UlaG (beta-lactamase superfamily)
MQPMSPFRLMVVLMLGLPLLSNCQSNPYYNPSKPHHTAEGFRNNYASRPPGNFWKWQWERFRDDLPREPANGYHPAVAQTDPAFLAANRTVPALTWIGHATLLLQYNGVNVLTDPYLTERASPFSFMGPRRKVPPALSFGQLPHIEIVVITHNHYDHLDAETVRRLNGQPGGPPRFLVPLGLKPWFAREGISNVTELDWWEHESHKGLEIMLVPAQHFSARTPWDRNETLWGGWVVRHPGFTFYISGDTGYSPDFEEIGRRVGRIDLAALPIGAYDPRWFMKTMHVDPEEAVQIYQDLGARYAVAMHWGTFQLTDEPIDEPPQRLAAALEQAGIPAERFFLMKIGESRVLTPLLKQSLAQAGK